MVQDTLQVGIVTPTYNRNQLLKSCLKQVKHQSYNNWHLVLVHDGLNAETQKLVEQLANGDQRITYLYVKDRSNDFGTTPRLEGARYLVEHKAVDYLIFWDDDNYFHQDALSQIVDAILAKDYPKLLLMPFRCKNSILPSPTVPLEKLHAGQIDSANLVVHSKIAVDCLSQVKELVDKETTKAYISDYLFFDEIRNRLTPSEVQIAQALPIGLHDGLRYFQSIRWALRIPSLKLGRYMWYRNFKKKFYQWL